MQAGTPLTGLVATYSTTGTAVKIGSAVQTSGVTTNDFSLTTTSTYTVVANDSSTIDYVVTISERKWAVLKLLFKSILAPPN